MGITIGGSGSLTVTNAILWGNGSGAELDQINHPIMDPPTVSYSIWQNHTGGTENLDVDPEFRCDDSHAWLATDTASYDADSIKTTFTFQSWPLGDPADLVGSILIANASDPPSSHVYTAIAGANGFARTLSVWGDYSTFVSVGNSFAILRYSLEHDSPAIDEGNNSAVPAESCVTNADCLEFGLLTCGQQTAGICDELDLEGNPRLTDGDGNEEAPGVSITVDMGAYEAVEYDDNAPLADPTGVPKNRYVAYAPSNGNRLVRYRVVFDDTTLGVCTTSADCTGSAICVGGICSNHDGFTKLIDSVWWVGTPDASGISRLQCTVPAARNWCDSPVVYVGDEAIVPESTYRLQSIDASGNINDEDDYSAALIATTASTWGDLDDNGNVNFTDISLAVSCFSTGLLFPAADVDPQLPDKDCDFDDIYRIVDAFQGLPYPFLAPAVCP